MNSLLDALLNLLQLWERAFPQQRTFGRAMRLALAQVLVPGSRNLSRIIAASGNLNDDWSADYRIFSRSPWKQNDLFSPIIKEALGYFDKRNHITLAGDFTHLPKTGTHIPNVHCMRDPMSPPFNVNLIYGLRFMHYTMVLPLYEEHQPPDSRPTPPRSIPIRFEEAPAPKKPGRKATPEERAQYKAVCATHPASQKALDVLIELRKEFDALGVAQKDLVVALDGSFCNRVFFRAVIDRVELVARCRKDAVLCFRAPLGGRRFYGEEKITPEVVRADESRPYSKARLFHGGDWREMRYKEIPQVFWAHGAKRRPLRLIVLAPTPYHNSPKGKRFYRQPAYLLTTDLQRPAHEIIQCYLDRWQIEVNHRDQKTHFGVGDAQVRNPKSVPRQPAFVVCVYAAILLAAQRAYGSGRGAQYIPLPKWRRKSSRPSCLDIVNQLRREMEEHPEKLVGFRNRTGVTANATFHSAA